MKGKKKALFPMLALVLVLALAVPLATVVAQNGDGCQCPEGTTKGDLVETVTVPANNSTGVSSIATLDDSTTYILEASGTWYDTSQSDHYKDAEWTTFNGWNTHEDGTPNWGPNQKDLQVDDLFVEWGDYNDQHEYCLQYQGTGAPVHFRIFDGQANADPPVIGPPSWYADNHGELTVDIYECVSSNRDVSIDIKPTSCPNPLNVKGKGVLPVAILGTVDFDVTQIDPASVELERVSPLRGAFEDVATPYDGTLEVCDDCSTEGADGYMDLTLKFDKQEVVAALEALGEVSDGDCVVLTLTGNLKEAFGGTAISGQDVVRIIKKGK